MAPDEDSSFKGECGSVCRMIREYPCGCECGGAWQKQCASISGRVINDVDKDGKLDEGEVGITQALVELFVYNSETDEFDFVAEQHSGSSGGHYAFSNLAPGKYKVRVTLPNCFVHEEEVNHRIVTLSCTESAQAAQRINALYNGRTAPHSVQLEHRENGAHLAQNIDFFAYEDCDAADEQRNNVGSEGDLGAAPGVPESATEQPQSEDSPSSTGLSNLAIGLIIGSLVCAVCLVILCVWATSRRRGARLFNRRATKKAVIE